MTQSPKYPLFDAGQKCHEKRKTLRLRAAMDSNLVVPSLENVGKTRSMAIALDALAPCARSSAVIALTG